MKVQRIYSLITQIELKSTLFSLVETEKEQLKIKSAINSKLLLLQKLTKGDLTDYVCNALREFQMDQLAFTIKIGSLQIQNLETFTIGDFDLEEPVDKGQLICDNEFLRQTGGCY